jgi:hypothetical protein
MVDVSVAFQDMVLSWMVNSLRLKGAIAMNDLMDRNSSIDFWDIGVVGSWIRNFFPWFHCFHT